MSLGLFEISVNNIPVKIFSAKIINSKIVFFIQLKKGPENVKVSSKRNNDLYDNKIYLKENQKLLTGDKDEESKEYMVGDSYLKQMVLFLKIFIVLASIAILCCSY